MSNTNTTTSSATKFFKGIVAKLTGDQTTVIALKNEKKAIAAFKSQISKLEFTIGDLETAVDDAKENLANVLAPTTLIGDATYFVKEVVAAQERVKTAEFKLKETQDSIETYKALLAEWF